MVVIKDRTKIADLGNDFFNKGDETAFIPKDCFPGRDGESRCFDYLSAKLEICPTQVDAGLSIVIDNMDSWLGNSVLRGKYRADTGLAA